MWIVMGVYPFSAITIDHEPLPDKTLDKGPSHFCPVFDNYQDALNWSNGKYTVLPLFNMMEGR